MTVRFRIDSVVLTTTEGSAEYRFTSDLTVLAGPTGVGKTTLIELIKFGFGAKAILAPVATAHVDSVTLEVQIGDEKLRLVRSLDKAKSGTVRLTDLITQERLPDHYVGDKQPSLNTRLMQSLGLPDDMRAAGSRSKREGPRITFNDILTYLYIPQSEINQDIAHSQDTFREPKRRAVFELLFGLTDSEILKLQSDINRLNGEIDVAEAEHHTVVKFLRESRVSSREEAEIARQRVRLNQTEAQNQLARLRHSFDPVADRETQTLRDLLTEAERSLADTRAAAADLSRRHTQYTAERRRVQGDLERLRRMRDAGERLADIEFTVCPRCMQSVQQREVPHGACRLCLQDDPVQPGTSQDHHEIHQLTAQISEIDEQTNAVSVQQEVLLRATTERERLIAHLTTLLDQRTAERIAPRLQAFSDASEQAATAKAEQTHWEAILRQWDVVADLQSEAERLSSKRKDVERHLETVRQSLQRRRQLILNEISEEFDATVRAFGIPGVVTAAIDDEKYLPVLNGKLFSRKNQLAGGTTTATQVAYWCALLSVAMRNSETTYPAFLLIDSPQLALNSENNLTAAMYRRLTTQVDAQPGRLQIILADNKLPDSYRDFHAQIDFDYSRPTVSTITHPGPAQVTTIGESVSTAGEEQAG